MSIANNDVTYAEKWNTPENKAALKKLETKYFDKSSCAPDCPIAWAPEVLELFETLDRELGFTYNTSTMRGYYIQGTAKDWFVTDPWKNLFRSVKTNFFSAKPPQVRTRTRVDITYRNKTIVERLAAVTESFMHSINYGKRACVIKYVNPIRNKYSKNKISLGQLKEKWGSLTIYFNAPPAFEDYIEDLIRKTEIKLALKGAYYPIESLWNNRTSYNIENEHRPDAVTITYGEYKGERTVTMEKTTYRQAMKDLGLDLKEIKAKADLRAASKADPV